MEIESVNKYAVLQEMNDSEIECWLYFIKYQGNEEVLSKLQKDLESIEWEMMDEGSTFDLDLEHLVSEITAKEMTKLELNHHQWHRKFDGKLDKINFDFKKDDDNEDKMTKVCDILNYGQIDNFIGDEDIDEEDLTDTEYKSDEDLEITEDNIDDLMPRKK
jgi:hypothetical protein